MLLMLWSAVTLAAEQPPVRVHGWRVEDQKGWCSATTGFNPDVFMMVGYDVAHDTSVFSIYSPRWRSIAEDANYPLRIDFSNERYYSTSEAKGEVLGDAGTQPFGVSTVWKAEEYLGDFAAASWMEIRVRGTLLGRFSLKGTREMVRALARCAEKSFRDYPGDPFEGVAPTSARPSTGSGSAAATPARRLGGSISDADYPAAAIREGAEGTTRVMLEIGVNGRVTGCSVTGSSGSALLDSTACQLLSRRYRFAPATQAGQPVASSYSTAVRWSLPSGAAPVIPMEVPAPAVAADGEVPAEPAVVQAPHPFEPVQPSRPDRR